MRILSDPRPDFRIALLTAGVVACAFVFSLAVNLPGHLSYDSVMQLYEGRLGRFGGWHPPVMSWLLGLFDRAGAAAALFVLMDSLLLFGALLSLPFLTGRGSWLSALLALAAAATPQLLIYPGIVWKDVLFAGATLAGFVCLMHAAAHWNRKVLRTALAMFGFLLLVLAALSRQNGLLLLLAGAAGWSWVAASCSKEHKSRAAFRQGAVALFCTVLIVVAANATFNLFRSNSLDTFAQLRILETYDLAGAIKADPGIGLGQLDRHEPELAEALRKQGAPIYNSRRSDPLMADLPLRTDIAASSPSTIFRQWRDLIVFHPWLYLKLRAAVFWQVFATPDVAACTPFEVGIDGPPQVMNALGLKERYDGRDTRLADYASTFEGLPVYSHIAFFAVALAALFLLLLRRRPQDRMMIAFLAGTVLFAASFFLISIACDYRYLYVLDVSAIAAAIYLALEPRSLIAAFRGAHRSFRKKRPAP